MSVLSVLKTNVYKSKAQLSFFVKTVFVLISSLAFVFILFLFSKYQEETRISKESSQFRMEALSILQKLITSPECLASSEESKKVVIDREKLEKFSQMYSETEPKCARALTFDYNITILQLEKHTVLYPGTIIVSGEPTYVNALAFHEKQYNSTHVYYSLCNFSPNDEHCRGELDGPTNCPNECLYNPISCPPEKIGRTCCVIYICPKEKCEVKENKMGGHPWVVLCEFESEEDLKSSCEIYKGHLHKWCGKVSIDMPIEVGIKRELNVEKKEWNVGVKSSVGINAFSPEKAKKEELKISMPVIIRYNETFSTEGILYFHAVRGELEELNSLLEDLCEKAESGIILNFSKNLHFSYPVKYSFPNICMLNSCKKFECSYSLDFEEIEASGDYSLKFSIDSNNKKIVVRK